MENGVEVLDKGAEDGIGLVEMKESEGDEVFEEAIECETPGFVLDKGAEDGIGLVEMKESEGDEVFEEAIECETPGFGIEGGSLGSVTNYMDENVNSDSRDEVDNFEEVVEASHEIQQTDATGDKKPSVAKSENGEVHAILGTQDAKGGNDYVQMKVHYYRDALLGDEVNPEVIETSNIQPAGHQDCCDVHKDVSFSSGFILKDERDIQLEEVQSHHFKH
ncbi:hypothetical protein RND71_005792 [Anisodus tanguticus]|uniref:Uncharacterized protein n=1 Tax=Anisodus tanguticus TaxID=243964 RepID=A0AAE1VVR7_9SOLA|nr:hypothetical protein RND71_005792 [Anisodus tanguticus]